MNRLRKYLRQLRRPIKYSASDPGNFDEIWTFNATGIQLISLLILFILVVGITFSILINRSSFSGYVSKNDVTIERKKLEDQYAEIKRLNQRLEEQDAYISTLRKILSGEVILDSLDENVPDISTINTTDLETEPTENEKALDEKVKDDLRTGKKGNGSSKLQFFAAPVTGTISQHFDGQKHPGVDVITSPERDVLACLSGTVVYAGYTLKDGFLLIIDHSNGYLSVYKHNRSLLKKVGAKVRINDPVAIVGNTGENTSGPHLHFELWYDQSAVDPEQYMKF